MTDERNEGHAADAGEHNDDTAGGTEPRIADGAAPPARASTARMTTDTKRTATKPAAATAKQPGDPKPNARSIAAKAAWARRKAEAQRAQAEREAAATTPSGAAAPEPGEAVSAPVQSEPTQTSARVSARTVRGASAVTTTDTDPAVSAAVGTRPPTATIDHSADADLGGDRAGESHLVEDALRGERQAGDDSAATPTQAPTASPATPAPVESATADDAQAVTADDSETPGSAVADGADAASVEQAEATAAAGVAPDSDAAASDAAYAAADDADADAAEPDGDASDEGGDASDADADADADPESAQHPVALVTESADAAPADASQATAADVEGAAATGRPAILRGLPAVVKGRRPQHGRGGEPRKKKAPYAPPILPASAEGAALVVRELTKHFGSHKAVDRVDLTVPAGAFYGIVGPNGAGKTTTLSMISGLLRPDSGAVSVCGVDAQRDSRAAKKLMGVLPDRFRTFDRLTGTQLLHYYGALRGLPSAVVDTRTADLARAFDLTEALNRVVSDYSAGMTKKVMLAGALIHSPRLLVLDEPFESVDPVSSAVILDILTAYVKGGGTVILSSHGMDLVERVCSRVAVIVSGQVLAEGTVDEVRQGMSLEQRFVELSGGLSEVEGLEWLHTYSG